MFNSLTHYPSSEHESCPHNKKLLIFANHLTSIYDYYVCRVTKVPNKRMVLTMDTRSKRSLRMHRADTVPSGMYLAWHCTGEGGRGEVRGGGGRCGF